MTTLLYEYLGMHSKSDHAHLECIISTQHLGNLAWPDLTWPRERGDRTSSKNHMKKLHPFLGNAERLRRFTEIKQVSAHSIQVCQISIDACDLFCF